MEISTDQITKENEQSYRQLLDNIHEGVYFVDLNKRITYWNKGAERITGFSKENVMGTCCSDNILMHVTQSGVCLCQTMCPLAATMKDGKSREAHVFLHHADGHRVPVTISATPLRDDKKNVSGAVEMFSEMYLPSTWLTGLSETQQEQCLDALTSLGNTHYTEDFMTRAFTDMEMNGIPFGVMLCGVDRFDLFEAKHGRETAERLLKLIARTLKVNVLSSDFVGRTGESEFFLGIVNVDADRMMELARKIQVLTGLSRLHKEGNDDFLMVTTTVSVAMPERDDTVHDLLSRARKMLAQGQAIGGRCVYPDR